jgi:cytochrome oxidase Cu insertion factor (SCO1/SenC/PrrC family)
METQSNRRKRIAILAVVVPILVGIVIAAVGHIAGHETDITKPRPLPEQQLRTATAAAEAGTPAPRVRLAEAASGHNFDSSSLGGAPYAVVFITTRCGAIGDYLGHALAKLGGEGADAAILAISADPAIDTRSAVRSWLARNHLERGTFHYLTGTEAELGAYWSAWGLTGPSPTCTGSVPAHLVNGSGENAGVIDLDPQAAVSILTDDLSAMSK